MDVGVEIDNSCIFMEVTRELKIAIGSDHGGFRLKSEVKALLDAMGVLYEDFGCYSTDSVDYPDVAEAVCEAILKQDYTKGILICGTGIGISIAANKVPGIRAALCHDTFSATATREHNDSNVLAMGERVIGAGLACDIVKAWLGTEFGGGRHQRRVDKISEIEQKYNQAKV